MFQYLARSIENETMCWKCDHKLWNDNHSDMTTFLPVNDGESDAINENQINFGRIW